MGEHTKTPWHVNHDRPNDLVSQLSISNGDARIIANVVTRDTTHGWEGGSANAAFICKAVNNHEALVKALQTANHYCHRATMPREAVEQIEAALQGVVGKS